MVGKQNSISTAPREPTAGRRAGLELAGRNPDGIAAAAVYPVAGPVANRVEPERPSATSLPPTAPDPRQGDCGSEREESGGILPDLIGHITEMKTARIGREPHGPSRATSRFRPRTAGGDRPASPWGQSGPRFGPFCLHRPFSTPFSFG